ncbi:hypothetical protein H7J87_20360 [Mycolicibacterium wolinskyi]|uniref:hypothetical protein n=1 Tax=Mycolicibacterium TaxID=1866885 RepID=UPI001054D217|nr:MULTISPECIES: hypothetical protein [Mycolicibacterium]MCV7287683.1 hypothetical protein [Mycolicibacterium wolinskyi]MCV7294581.1 hypothetical protein [Mycolicibacterium goodii]
MSETYVRGDVAPRSLPRPDIKVPTFIRFGFWLRIALVGLLTGVAYLTVFAATVEHVVAQSRAAYLLVLPVLTVVIIAGYRRAPGGVGDDESDWIIACLVGAAGLCGVHLVAQRMPTLAGLWHVQLQGAVIWAASCTAILLGVRYALRMWPLWIFLVCTVSPLPYLLAVATLGGSDTAAACVAAGVGAVAVFLAAHAVPVWWRLGSAIGCLATALIVIAWLEQPVGLLLMVVVAGGVIPVVFALTVLHLRTTNLGISGGPEVVPRRSPRQIAILLVLAAALAMGYPAATRIPDPPEVNADWVQRAGLLDATPMTFASRFLGPDATLTRYTVPPAPGMPSAAVDVITTSNLAALQDFSDAVWYPSEEPTSYTAADHLQLPIDARIVYSNSDSAISDASRQWYAVTWVWRSQARYQQVTIVINQNSNSPDSPAEPRPLTLNDSIVSPTLWLTRQQPSAAGGVDETVLQRAAQVARVLTTAAQPR